jgi:heme-degrading monooxygenase HmoA
VLLFAAERCGVCRRAVPLRQSRGSAEPYDGITEVWWESLEAVRAGMGAPGSLEAQQRLMEDESKFIDFARSCVFMTEEHVIFGD